MNQLKDFFDRKVEEYNKPAFIPRDPICIPHLFTKKQDIEVAGFFASIFAWGNRTTIINKSKELMQLMDMSPYDYVVHHSEEEIKRLLAFKHRTFNATDLLYFIEFLRHHYSRYKSLEDAFVQFGPAEIDFNEAVEGMLIGFHNYFFSMENMPPRTRKHIATPAKNSSCKRLNMFLRWMVRNDKKGVDFGLWKKIKPAQLICPVDLHVARVAKRFNLLTRKQVDWQAAIELTAYLRTLDAADPVKYDFALFGLGVLEKF
ncbi:MAG TPA: TIGR02757 family protein [Chitinophagaceae bacterium]|nr:TIGR02757 family protein [Chitinophagaceae bacterium]